MRTASKGKELYKLKATVLLVVRNKEGKWLVVDESKNRGWSLPGGHVDPPESYIEAGCRETREEAGVDVSVKGVLRFEYSIKDHNKMRLRVILYAEPIDENQKPKSTPDKHSNGAKWVTLEELLKLN